MTSIDMSQRSWFWKEDGSMDLGWSDESKRQGCCKEKRTEEHILDHCPSWSVSDVGFQRLSESCRTSSSSGSGKEALWRTPLSESQWNRGHSSVKKWESEKHKKLEKGFKSTWQQMALIWAWLESGMLVVGQWCKWVTTKNWGFCMGCMARWR